MNQCSGHSKRWVFNGKLVGISPGYNLNTGGTYSFSRKSSAIIAFPRETSFSRFCPQVLLFAKKSPIVKQLSSYDVQLIIKQKKNNSGSRDEGVAVTAEIPNGSREFFCQIAGFRGRGHHIIEYSNFIVV